MLVPHEERALEHKRYKWMKWEAIPKEIIRFSGDKMVRKINPWIKPPSGMDVDGKDKEKKKPTAGPNPTVPDDKDIVIIVKDWELDFTQKENVDFIIKKY